MVILKSELQPVGAKDDLTAEGDKQDQQDKTAAAAGAGYSPAKAKTILKPIKYHIQHQKFKQTSKAALLSIHRNLLFSLPKAYTIIIEKSCGREYLLTITKGMFTLN